MLVIIITIIIQEVQAAKVEPIPTPALQDSLLVQAVY
jgi:hypothetical protein